MIKPQDLRIGNWAKYVIDNGRKTQDVFIDKYHLINALNDPNSYKPIPLTEEWLRAFGFIVTFSGNLGWWRLFKDNDCLFDMFGFGGLFYFNYRKSYEVELNYVHQLQNLYFALTGNELKHERL